MLRKLLFMLVAGMLVSEAMAREPYLNNGHFSGLNENWRLEKPEANKAGDNLSSDSSAVSDCPQQTKQGDNQNDDPVQNQRKIKGTR